VHLLENHLTSRSNWQTTRVIEHTIHALHNIRSRHTESSLCISTQAPILLPLQGIAEVSQQLVLRDTVELLLRTKLDFDGLVLGHRSRRSKPAYKRIDLSAQQTTVRLGIARHVLRARTLVGSRVVLIECRDDALVPVTDDDRVGCIRNANFLEVLNHRTPAVAVLIAQTKLSGEENGSICRRLACRQVPRALQIRAPVTSVNGEATQTQRPVVPDERRREE